MPENISNNSFFKKLWKSKTFRWVGGIFLVLVIIIFFVIKHNSKTSYQFITVTKGPITESVSLTGNTTPGESVSLSFDSSGIISRTFSGLGKQVYPGQVVAELNTNDLVAQLHEAQANVDVQKAKLLGLQSGSRPEDIAASQASLDKANQDLANMYASASDTSIDSYAKANDAVRTELDPLFVNSETSSASLTYTITNNQVKYAAESGRISSSTTLNTWQDQIKNNTQASESNAQTEVLIQDEIQYLTSIRTFLNNVSDTFNYNPNLSATTISAYKVSISAALNEVNTASKNLNTILQNIASQKLTISQLQAQFDLKRAGALPSDISAGSAQVEQAEASVQSALAKLRNAEIIAPIAGTITQFDARVGELASLNMPLVSIMSDEGYEVDAGVSEIDVGKISSGDKVSMTLDAFPNETLTGVVFYIAPAENNINGVISYKIKISFDKLDPRLKSGLTANVNIQTNHKDEVLILPEYAILQNDEGTFVEILRNNKTEQVPVVLGIQDEKGNVEIVSGVTEGEQVLNIGLKS